jgi:hypothetical protein
VPVERFDFNVNVCVFGGAGLFGAEYSAPVGKNACKRSARRCRETLSRPRKPSVASVLWQPVARAFVTANLTPRSSPRAYESVGAVKGQKSVQIV